MPAQHLVEALTALFILLMIWLRTRMHYAQSGGTLQLQPSGRAYFAGAGGTIVLGWLLAPALGRALMPAAPISPTIMRVAWFLGTYYLFILVHRLLRKQGTPVYRRRDVLK